MGYKFFNNFYEPKEIYKYKQIYSRISSYKNSLITVKAYNSNNELIESDRQARRPRLIDIYSEYVNRCFKAGAMDFDDLLTNTVRLFRQHPDVLRTYQERFKHILIDEYQDTNMAQNEIVLLLGALHHNVCVVGDTDQSVYRFRGADFRNIMQFENAFPEVTTVVLAQNYRSTQTILDAANAVITNNVDRKPKDLWTDLGQGEKIIRYFADDEFGLSNQQSYRAIQAARGNPDAEVTIYRGVPNEESITSINAGDFVTLSPKYAERHASSGYGPRGEDAGKVISQKVKVKDVYFAGDDVNEFGYFPDTTAANASKSTGLLTTSAADLRRQANIDRFGYDPNEAPEVSGFDAYLRRVNPSDKRIPEENRPNLMMGDMYGMLPKSAQKVSSVGDVDFDLLVSGGHLETTVEQLSKLSEGDILSFNPPETAQVKVNGFPLYEANVGIKGSKVAIKIDDNIMEREV